MLVEEDGRAAHMLLKFPFPTLAFENLIHLHVRHVLERHLVHISKTLLDNLGEGFAVENGVRPWAAHSYRSVYAVQHWVGNSVCIGRAFASV